jgi:predicted nucleic acid-binding protein
MIVVDSSVWFDLFALDGLRKNLAKNFLRLIEDKNMPVLEPRVFEIEFIALLSRRYGGDEALNIFTTVKNKIVVLPNPDGIAFSIAHNTGCRAIDSYFIALAKLTDSILISNDRIQVNNAKKAEIEAYYLLEEFDEIKAHLEKVHA